MKNMLRGVWLLSLVTIVSCVTINIYFPAEEIRGAADRIVDEVYGEKAETSEPTPAQPGSSFIPALWVGVAYAAQDIDVTTPEIRAIRADMKDRFGQLESYLNAGNIGIAADGLLGVRSQEGLDLKQRAEMKRLVDAENKDRMRLYQEIARANGFPEKAGEVQSIFADSWRDKAAKGWYLQNGKGWQQK
jgi:uncharacterized protein YdbL (DUF1318 family)